MAHRRSPRRFLRSTHHAGYGGARANKTYTAVVEQCPDTGLYVGYVPGFPGAHTQAETLDELSRNLREVFEILLEDEPPLDAQFRRDADGYRRLQASPKFAATAPLKNTVGQAILSPAFGCAQAGGRQDRPPHSHRRTSPPFSSPSVGRRPIGALPWRKRKLVTVRNRDYLFARPAGSVRPHFSPVFVSMMWRGHSCVGTPADGVVQAPTKCRDESRHGRHECPRHIG